MFFLHPIMENLMKSNRTISYYQSNYFKSRQPNLQDPIKRLTLIWVGFLAVSFEVGDGGGGGVVGVKLHLVPPV